MADPKDAAIEALLAAVNLAHCAMYNRPVQGMPQVRGQMTYNRARIAFYEAVQLGLAVKNETP